MQELFETRNGRVIMDEDLSSKMYLIKQYHPEKADETSSGFEWSEMGMKQWEYEALQDALTKKSENNPYGRTGNFKREDGYKEGILAATVKAPHTYMKAVGTRELEKILEEELGNEDTKRHTC